MNEFKNKIAVITGAASGIGHALAVKCVDEGMKVVLADIDKEKLIKTRREINAQDDDILLVKTDVSKYKDVQSLADKTLDRFNEIHMLFNNAGVFTTNYLWEHTIEDWNWLLGVNLWGVIYGVKVFVPILLKQQIESHIINTASITGLLPGQGIYGITKKAIVALSETLYSELNELKANVNVSVVCPSYANTQLSESEAHRPIELTNQQKEIASVTKRRLRRLRKVLTTGITCDIIAEKTFDGIKKNRFYIVTDDLSWWKDLLRKRHEYIMEGQNPDDLPMSTA